MKRKYQIALNRLFCAFVLFSLLFLCLAYASLGESIGLAIGLFVVALIGLAAAFITQPFCYRFDSDGVTMCYTFFSNERYLWRNISAIEVREDSGSHKSLILDLFLSYAFHLYGNAEGRHRFYMQGEIRKTLRTKRLLEKYWDGNVTGYLNDDIKEWKEKRRSRKAKKDREIAKHLADEIVPMEREARARFRSAVAPITDQAALMGLDLRTEYIYLTQGGGEYKSRPEQHYTYAALVKLSARGETDANRVVEVGIDLLFVRLGKNAYRGVENGNFSTELTETLSDVLAEIRENGMESYCREIE